ncbi:MAG: enoyl-CoA hydratase-related protein [Cyclobacteriaceae bacterium]|nr:enoyl-CoA hydratase-related protein [Cyclobacteriaceae bacterium]
MKIQFITTSFNGMAQRLWIELDRLNHEVKLHIASSSKKMIEAVNNYTPNLIIAPFLTSKIPKEIYENYTCLIVHPGIKGDRGASSLDWAILQEKKTWGVTILQAAEKMDAGPIWASNEFNMRPVSKAEIYRNEVTQAAAKGILQALSNFENLNFAPERIDNANTKVKGKWNNKTTQEDFQFNWHDKAKSIITKINAADSSPGVLIRLFDNTYYCYGAQIESSLKGNLGEIIGQRHGAICIATQHETIWISHLKSTEPGSIKLPASIVLKNNTLSISVDELPLFENTQHKTWQEIRFELKNGVGYIHFNFYNGAMSTNQCNRLKQAIIKAKEVSPLLVLMGGKDIWSNGIHLNVIENAKNSADESWKNINAIDDLILEIINATEHYIICALQGNAGAGGVSLALSGDKVVARNGIVLNPHTQNMGLYGSEYWTYLLPKRIGIDKATKFTEECLPWGVAVAKEIGLIDDYFGETNEEFVNLVQQQAEGILSLSYFDKLIAAKSFQRKKDEMNKPLADYREEELAKMKVNFYENNLNYNHKRHCFVHKKTVDIHQNSNDLYSSRRNIYRKRKWESINYKDGK